MELSLIEKVALSKAGESKTPDLGDNSVHHVDFTVRVRGTMRQGKGYERNCPASANMQAILALALSKLNMTTAQSIADLVREASVGNSEELDKQFNKIKDYADAAIQQIKDATKVTCKGKLSVALDVTKVDNVEVEPTIAIEMKDVPTREIVGNM